MECVISTNLYNIIKELTIKGDLKSFGFCAYSKFFEVTINEILNNKNYEELQEQLEEFAFDNEFMFNADFFPYLEEGTLKIKVTFTEDDSDYDETLWTMEDLYVEIKDKLDKKLGPGFDLDNLDLQMSIESNREFGIQLDSYNLIYSVPESDELINLSEDKDLKMAIFDYFRLWVTKNYLGTRAILGEELDFNFSIEIEESSLSSYIEYIYDTITLNITE
jgi:hypothetical protein